VLQLIFLALIISPAPAGEKREKKESGVHWVETLDEAKLAAAKYLHPIVVHFCPLPPERVAFNEDASTFDTAEVKALAPDVVFVRIPPESQPELEKQYSVKEIPTIVLIDEAGNRLWKNIEGHCDWPDLVKAIKSAFEKRSPLKAKDCEKLDRAWAAYEGAIAKKDYRNAVRALATIKTVSRKTYFHSEMEKALKTIDAAADDKLEEAQKLEESEPDKAEKIYSEIEKSFETRPAAAKAKEAREAILLKNKTKAPPETACEKARKLFKEAVALRDGGNSAAAKEKLEELIKKYPNEPFAAEARRILEEMTKK